MLASCFFYSHSSHLGINEHRTFFMFSTYHCTETQHAPPGITCRDSPLTILSPCCHLQPYKAHVISRGLHVVVQGFGRSAQCEVPLYPYETRRSWPVSLSAIRNDTYLSVEFIMIPTCQSCPLYHRRHFEKYKIVVLLLQQALILPCVIICSSALLPFLVCSLLIQI